MKFSLKNYTLAQAVTVVAVLFIAVGVAVGFYLFNKRTATVVSVTGYASEFVESDSAIWYISFTHDAGTRQSSYDTVLADAGTVTAYLKEYGLDQYITDSGSFDTGNRYGKDDFGYSTDEVVGYYTEATIVVETDDVYAVSEAYSNINDLVIKGIQFTENYPSYYYSGLDELKLSLLDDAMKNARERADLMVEGDDLELGEATSIRQGVFQVNVVGDKSVSDYGNYDTSSIEKEVSAVVSVEFVSL